jgi:hypothetical protein
MLQKSYRIPFVLTLFAAIPVGSCFADTIDLGFVQFLQGSNTAASFNVLNDTGANASVSPDTSFPVTTSIPFTDLTLYVNYADGTADVFTPSSGYFTLAGDNLSYIGTDEPSFVSKPISSALLTGTFGVTKVTLNDGSTASIEPTFTAQVTDSSGNLQAADFAYITATTSSVPPVSGTPEPRATVILPLCCVAALALFRRAVR